MSTIAFDTLKFANKLKAAGVAPAQAEAEAEAMAEVFEVNIRELATKDDLRHALEKLDLSMTIKLGAMVVAGMGAVAAIVKLL